jgi:hypothetical protein
MMGGWRRLHEEEINKLYASQNNIRMIKTRNEMVGVCNTDGRDVYKMLVGILTRRDHFEDLGVDGRIILEWILGKLGGKEWTRFTFHRVGTNGRQLWTRQ